MKSTVLVNRQHLCICDINGSTSSNYVYILLIASKVRHLGSFSGGAIYHNHVTVITKQRARRKVAAQFVTLSSKTATSSRALPRRLLLPQNSSHSPFLDTNSTHEVCSIAVQRIETCTAELSELQRSPCLDSTSQITIAMLRCIHGVFHYQRQRVRVQLL